MIDYDRLRQDLYDECMAGYFIGKIGPFSFIADDVLKASEDELIELANYLRFNIEEYIIKESNV